jgi:hypothetical protein
MSRYDWALLLHLAGACALVAGAAGLVAAVLVLMVWQPGG